MSAPATLEQRMQVIRFNDRFTLHYYNDTQTIHVSTDASEHLEITLPQGECPDQFRHPDAGNGISKRSCVRARRGTVTIWNIDLAGFVGHDLVTNTIMVFNDDGDILYRSGVIVEVVIAALPQL